jgi:hypothetical protein
MRGRRIIAKATIASPTLYNGLILVRVICPENASNGGTACCIAASLGKAVIGA